MWAERCRLFCHSVLNPVSVISQVIGCEDRLRNDLLCTGWGIKLAYYHSLCDLLTVRCSIPTLQPQRYALLHLFPTHTMFHSSDCGPLRPIHSPWMQTLKWQSSIYAFCITLTPWIIAIFYHLWQCLFANFGDFLKVFVVGLQCYMLCNVIRYTQQPRLIIRT